MCFYKTHIVFMKTHKNYMLAYKTIYNTTYKRTQKKYMLTYKKADKIYNTHKIYVEITHKLTYSL